MDTKTQDDELAAAGVTIGEIEPTRAQFEEHVMSREPITDRELVLVDGTSLRERIVEASADSQGGRSLTITNALLDVHRKVVRDAAGAPILSRHEVRFTAEGLARLRTAEAMAEALKMAREVAAAKAAAEIAAQQQLDALMADRR